MAHHCFRLFRRQHLRLGPKLRFVFLVIDASIARGNNKHGIILHQKRQRFGNTLRRALQGLGRQLHRSAGGFQNPDTFFHMKRPEISLDPFNRHILFSLLCTDISLVGNAQWPLAIAHCSVC